MMKKIFYFFVILIMAMVVVSPVFADVQIIQQYGEKELGEAAKVGGYSSETTGGTVFETVGVIISVLLSMVGVIFLSFTVYAGYLWMTARGEEEPVKKAQKILITAIIGLVIVAGAYVITNFIVPNLLIKTTVNPDYY